MHAFLLLFSTSTPRYIDWRNYCTYSDLLHILCVHDIFFSKSIHFYVGNKNEVDTCMCTDMETVSKAYELTSML